MVIGRRGANGALRFLLLPHPEVHPESQDRWLWRLRDSFGVSAVIPFLHKLPERRGLHPGLAENTHRCEDMMRPKGREKRGVAQPGGVRAGCAWVPVCLRPWVCDPYLLQGLIPQCRTCHDCPHHSCTARTPGHGTPPSQRAIGSRLRRLHGTACHRATRGDSRSPQNGLSLEFIAHLGVIVDLAPWRTCCGILPSSSIVSPRCAV